VQLAAVTKTCLCRLTGIQSKIGAFGRRVTRKDFFCFISCALLYGCGTSGHSALLPSAQTGATSLDGGSAHVAGTEGGATPFASGASFVAVFTANYPAAARSASFEFALPKLAVTHVIKLAPGCGSGSACQVTLTAPVGENERLRVFLYASPDGKGQALAFASQTATFFAGQTTTLDLPLSAIMARFTLGLTPSTVTVGQATPITIAENAFDAAGERLADGYVTTNLAKPGFSLDVTDADGFSVNGEYSGVGSGPITYRVQISGYPSATASLRFKAASPLTTGFALEPGGLVLVYPPSAGTPARRYVILAYAGDHAEPRYDADGVLWLPTHAGGSAVRIGLKPNGEWAGTLPLPGRLLTFDRNDKLYVGDPSRNAVDVYSGKNLVRQIFTPGPPLGAAVDRSGNVYVTIFSGDPYTVYEYGASGNGDVTPVAVNNTAAFVETDGAGNVYALYYPTTYAEDFGVWRAGTFGPKPPGTTYTPNVSPNDFGVDDTGDVYASPSLSHPADAVFYAPAGSSSFKVLPIGNIVSDVDGAIAVPMK
jgi:hypothetical protein